ncbi:F-box-like/WD repeat-containing protein TBL1XR1 isoform X2 [Dioscorea cayenensis subsp. rotundata]|uniref:F-box-like/WD repeat-containing protein TBL1XR1 isoform X2 n=1 Tax=Dioscorea cayennensis subsp. rotundata TaxID=55577 RepID=A0AB40D455_DIOCR|nr:F-box-like/WD repeat-containing protein TBL1XR1 isoform X2 [Dioscorea cayenensis subsp. rotundata]
MAMGEKPETLGTRIPETPLTNEPPRQPPPPFLAGEPSNPGTASSPVPPTTHPRSLSRLILFPNVDILGDPTSDQLNVLIFRYLEEKGFAHTAFNFATEAGIKNVNNIDKSAIPKGALFSFVQDGLRYTQLKSDSGSLIECCRLDPLDIITNSVHSLSQIIKHRKENAKKRTIDHGEGIDYGAADQEPVSKRQNKRKDKEHSKDMRMQQGSLDLKDQSKVDVHKGPLLMGQTPSMPSVAHQVSESDVFVLEGHSLEVSICAWSPTDSLLVVGSSNSMSRIWEISDDFSMRSSISRVHFINHSDAKTYGLGGPITTLAWNGEGELLATSSVNGRASIWNKNGKLLKTLDEHGHSISSMAWSRKGDFLLTGSYNNTVIIWDTRTWKSKQELTFDSELLRSVEWRNNTSFTTCLRDKRIYVWNVGDSQPIITFAGHQDEIGCIKWDPTGTLLASNSNDGAIKIWTLTQDKSLHNLMHCEGINSIRWRPTGPGTSSPNDQLLLASAGDDATVKIWDGAQGQLLYSFNGHGTPVFEIEFSPDGDYIASGSVEQRLLIWKVIDGMIVKSIVGCDPSIYNLSWNREGNKIAAGYQNSTLCVIPLW